MDVTEFDGVGALLIFSLSDIRMAFRTSRSSLSLCDGDSDVRPSRWHLPGDRALWRRRVMSMDALCKQFPIRFFMS